MKRLRMLLVVVVLFSSGRMTPLALAQLYAGALGGVATLSGDARSLLSPNSTAFSSYDPKNGGAVEVLVGKHFSDYFAAQGNYIWNGNGLTLTSATFNNGTQQGYQETRRSSQQSLIGDLLVYFRNRDSRLRPYLSVGTGLVHFSSSQERTEQALGAPALPPQRFSVNLIALHVPVGIDVRLGKSWAFRYTFSETLSKNPISDRLSPPGQHRLMNFQNLFGFTRRF
jgi:outer membrane protein with beta-barrel domain